MKQKVLILFAVLFAFNTLNAETMHQHPQHEQKPAKNARQLTWPGRCDVAIINHSYHPVTVYGIFDDGQQLGFDIYPTDPPHFISLFYYGSCHYDMFLSVSTFDSYNIYSNYTTVNSDLNIWPSYFNRFRTAITAR